MKINLWSINYYPEPIGIAVYNRQWSEYLASRGHEVVVTTAFPYYPDWKQQAPTWRKSEIVNGVMVSRHWLYVPRTITVARRIIHEISFVLHTLLTQLCSQRSDIIIVVSPPVLLGLAGIVIGQLKRTPVVFHIQDLQPDSAIGLGMLKQAWLIRLLLRIENLIYRRVSLITTISSEMANAVVNKGIDASKIQVIPNAIEVAHTDGLSMKGSWRAKFGIPADISLVSYSGNIGIKQGLDIVIDVAVFMQENRDVVLVICGDGADKRRLVSRCESAQLTNLIFLPTLSESDYRGLLVDSDLCLVTLKPGTGASFFPSKLLGILSSGRPVITNADPGSALHRAVENGGFGVIASNTPAALTQSILETLANPEHMQQMSAAALQFVAQFDERVVLPKLEELLHQIIGSERN